MAHDVVKHDYHLVEPSAWPLIGSIMAVCMALGGVVFMKGFVPVDPANGISPGELFFGKGHPWLLLLGFSGILYTMFGWWRDIIKEANDGYSHTDTVRLGLRYGMVMFIASEVMFFVAWFWIFFEMALFHGVRLDALWHSWPPQGLEMVSPWELPLINTLILLLSGTTVTWAHHAIQKNDRKSAIFGLALTVVLGACFTAIQAYEYHHILHENLFYQNDATKLYGSAFFMATGFHGFHVLIGTIFLTVCLIRMIRGDFTAKHHFGFEAAAWYWHFVDVVWLFLFAFIYVIFG
jgi:cytochrome c oxidase subunit 3